MSRALGHGDVITVHGSMYVISDDVGMIIHTGDAPSREVRAVPHNDRRARFASFQLNNPDPATYVSDSLSHSIFFLQVTMEVI